jgi:hypothetical protein
MRVLILMFIVSCATVRENPLDKYTQEQRKYITDEEEVTPPVEEEEVEESEEEKLAKQKEEEERLKAEHRKKEKLRRRGRVMLGYSAPTYNETADLDLDVALSARFGESVTVVSGPNNDLEIKGSGGYFGKLKRIGESSWDWDYSFFVHKFEQVNWVINIPSQGGNTNVSADPSMWGVSYNLGYEMGWIRPFLGVRFIYLDYGFSSCVICIGEITSNYGGGIDMRFKFANRFWMVFRGNYQIFTNLEGAKGHVLDVNLGFVF